MREFLVPYKLAATLELRAKRVVARHYDEARSKVRTAGIRLPFAFVVIYPIGVLNRQIDAGIMA